MTDLVGRWNLYWIQKSESGTHNIMVVKAGREPQAMCWLIRQACLASVTYGGEYTVRGLIIRPDPRRIKLLMEEQVTDRLKLSSPSHSQWHWIGQA